MSCGESPDRHGCTVRLRPAVNRLSTDPNAGLRSLWVPGAPFPWLSLERVQPGYWVVLSRQERLGSQLPVFIRCTLYLPVLNVEPIVVRERCGGSRGLRNMRDAVSDRRILFCEGSYYVFVFPYL